MKRFYFPLGLRELSTDYSNGIVDVLRKLVLGIQDVSFYTRTVNAMVLFDAFGDSFILNPVQSLTDNKEKPNESNKTSSPDHPAHRYEYPLLLFLVLLV